MAKQETAAPEKEKGRKPLTEAEKAARKEALANESKSDKFRRLAKKRVPAALAKIKNVGNLGGSGYEYTAEQVEKIETALNNAVAATVEKLQAGLKGDAKPAAQDFDI